MMTMMMTLNSCAVLLLSLLASLSCTANHLHLQGSENSDVCSMGGACPRILSPICATDGANNFRYFHNECLMQLDECRTETVWSEARMSLCLSQVDPLVLAECGRPCPFIYDPICATNGHSYQTFANECVFRVENCLVNRKWIMAQKNQCGLLNR